MGFKKKNGDEDGLVTAAQERIVEMYARLVEGRGFNRDDLCREFNVSKRTVQRDVDAIKMACGKSVDNGGEYQDLEYDRKDKVYKLFPPVRNLLSKSEAFAVIKVLLECRGFNHKEMKVLIDKLIKCCVAPSEQIDFHNQVNREFTNYIGPKHGKDVIDTVWELEEAVHKHYMVKIEYTRKDKSNIKRTLMPVAIMYSEYYFYLIAYIKSTKEDNIPSEKRFPTVYRVDRIASKKIYPTKTFSLNGISTLSESDIRKRVQFMFGGPLHKIKFYCANESVEAALDRLPTAKAVAHDEKRSIVEAEVYGEGVNMWLRSQGDKIQVIE